MSTLLILNAGSSSVKFQLVTMPQEMVITSGLVERIGLKVGKCVMKFNGEKIEYIEEFKDHEMAIRFVLDKFLENNILNSLDEIEACGHRMTHGAETFTSSVVIDENVEKEIVNLFDMAPLHMPANYKGYQIIHTLLPHIKNVAVFDTAFHHTLPKEAYIYPIPYEYYQKHKIRKYGFHGTSHYYVSQMVQKIDPSVKKIISCHMGNGVSVTAINDGFSINTSMGLTPLGGAMMGTRSGNIDPAIFEVIAKVDQLDEAHVLDVLNKQSGMLGLSGISNDARDIIDAAQAGDQQAILTLKVYARRISDYIGAYMMQLKGLDALIFTAGIGENSVYIRNMVLDDVKDALGIIIDDELNNANGDVNGLITKAESKVKVFVIATNEELVIAQDTYNLIK